MSFINHEELKKQLAPGEITSLDDITAEFKNILKEVAYNGVSGLMWLH